MSYRLIRSATGRQLSEQDSLEDAIDAAKTIRDSERNVRDLEIVIRDRAGTTVAIVWERDDVEMLDEALS